jgi:hypothetical protein
VSYDSKPKHNGNPLTGCDLKKKHNIRAAHSNWSDFVSTNYEGSPHYEYIPQGQTINIYNYKHWDIPIMQCSKWPQNWESSQMANSP